MATIPVVVCNEPGDHEGEIDQYEIAWGITTSTTDLCEKHARPLLEMAERGERRLGGVARGPDRIKYATVAE